jgi:uncharacterized protein DUF4333
MTAPVWPNQNGYPQAPQQPYGPPQGAIPPQGYGPPQQGYGPAQGYGPPQGYGPAGGYPPPAPAPARRRSPVKIILGVVGAIVVVLIGLGALFGSSSMNVEKALTKALEERPAITTVTDVNCPDDINTDKGSTGVCQATIDGQPADLTLSFDRDDHFVVTNAVPR